MMTFEEFEKHLHHALVHLYDPLYQPPPDLYRYLSLSQEETSRPTKPSQPPEKIPLEKVKHFKQMMIAAIEHLRPEDDVPARARSHRMYALLSSRYVQELTQEETADRLGITPRHLRREQQQAVLMLAQQLWEQCAQQQALQSQSAQPLLQPRAEHKLSPVTSNTAGVKGGNTGEVKEAAAEGDEEFQDNAAWRMQVQQEVAALQQNDPNTVAEIGAVLEHVRQLESRLVENNAITIQVNFVQEADVPPLVACMHPSLLRQLVIIAIQKLLSIMRQGAIICSAQRNGDVIELAIVGEPVAMEEQLDSEFIRETLAALGGTVQIRHENGKQGFYITLAYQPPISVLVVDDNQDLVHFYRRYTERTRYSISHVRQGQLVFERIAETKPQILVLDVMLPDIDGWEVLTRLHENPATSEIPVIICSVIRQKELALALGATLYLPKPVHRQDFLKALNTAMSRASRAN
jgi:CheY-like chemotaxis protein